MKRNRFIFCCLLLAALVGCAKVEINNINSKGKNIICFGDSLTLGYGAESGQDYPTLLAKMMSLPVINAGIDGDTSVEALKRIESDVLKREPLLVIIEFGGNDFLRKISLEKTVKNVEGMIKKIQAAGAMAAIADVGNGLVMGDYSKEFKRLSKEYNLIFIPRLLDGILTNPSLKSDFIHPNAEGYKLISQRVYRVILPYLNRNTLFKEMNFK